jgi:uroporphyrinogen-III synthase
VSLPLDGQTLVVTRPAAQAGPFIELARAAGAACIAYPTLQVEPVALSAATLARLRERRWDWAIFTSANAVAALAAIGAPPYASRHAAVGRATARALESAGVRVDATPQTANSEGLLEVPGLAELTGRGVLLVKGEGGRELLHEELRARGADVLELEMYRRVPVGPAAAVAAQLHAALIAVRPLVVTVTSAEILASLLEHVAAADAAGLRRQPLVVPGARVAAAAVRLGWQGPIIQAATAADEAMLHAVQALVHGAPPTA